jgi:MFS family permease
MEPTRAGRGLNCLAFFTAAAQTGFGPFVAIYLTELGWTQTRIGLALSVGTAVSLISQLPGGGLVDAIHAKRRVARLGLAGLAAAALALAFAPVNWIWGAEVLHSVASAVLTPSIAAITLAVCGHALYSERLGLNSRYASLGNAFAAVLMGACADYLSTRMVFVLAALLVLPALWGLAMVRGADQTPEEPDHPALLPPQARRAMQCRPWHIFGEPALHVFAFCTVLFGLSNAAMLTLALNVLTLRTNVTGFLVSASIMVPQLVAALAAPWVGSLAQRVGRRPILLTGFAALPLRALLFATEPGPVPLVMIQVLDGVSATVMGLMLPLIAADLTQRTGFLNLAIGSLGLGSTLGAMFSTTLAGLISDRFGTPAAFIWLAGSGALATVLLALLMPETRTAAPPPPLAARSPAEASPLAP